MALPPKIDNPFDSVKESQIVKGIKAMLEKEYGGVWYKIHGGPYQEAGIPDIVGVVNGHFFTLEVKRPEKRHDVSKQQRYQLNRLADAGAYTAVVTSVEEARNYMETYRGHIY